VRRFADHISGEMMWISEIRNLKTTVSVGIHPHEQTVQQEVVVNVRLHFSIPGPGEFTSIKDVVDYDPLRDLVLSWRCRPHTDLIESLLCELVDCAFFDQRVERVEASIHKTNIFPEAEGAGVALEVARDEWRAFRLKKS
jgi:7,8-dihydroneopterin aldolase/epimerase/oxygenase